MQVPLVIFLTGCAFFLACYVPTATAQQNAALIIGGYWYYGIEDPIQNYVELFGCEGTGVDSIELNHYPFSNYLAGGVWLPEDNRALVCGGYSCNRTTCNTVWECRNWEPTMGIWTEAPRLAARRFNYLMSRMPNNRRPEDGLVPLVLGYGLDTEIWDRSVANWVPHHVILDRNWYSLGCLVDYEGMIYSLRDSVVRLNPQTWDIEEIGTIPSPLIRSGRCSAATINGRPGIMTKFGYWYDLQDGSWTAKAFPPVTPVSGLTNALWTYRGKPTIFGNPTCNNNGTCLNTEVIAYSWETDTWDRIGSMLHPRTYQLMIEIPGSYCSNFASLIPTQGTTPAGGGGSSTTSKGTTTTVVSSSVMLLAVLFCSVRALWNN